MRAGVLHEILSTDRGGRLRLAVAAAAAGLFALYCALADRLPDTPLWAATALTALVLMPAAFSLSWLALPLRRLRELLALVVVLAAVAATLYAADLDVAANVAKLAAGTLAGFWFLTVFERVSWVVLVACIIPVVDTLSVWRGPTHEIVGDRPEVFGALSVSFPSPGDGAFQLGLPDVIFFALFLAAAVRWRLRPGWTWPAMLTAFGVTIALAVTTDPFGIGGLPALPGLSLAFLAANADLILRRRRGDPHWAVPVSLRAADAEALARFYRDAFGTRAESGDGTVQVWASWALNGGGRGGEIGFEVENPREAFRRAVEAGGEALREPAEDRWGVLARVTDPAGTRVAIRQLD